ncbi:MAG: glucuronate isomerase [Clostridia bacterium]|nr:glucuronate isomerase [Clostridia bacterium]
MGFINDDFLLKTETAKVLYHQYAKDMPIIDYHCHINPQEIATDRKFDNITQVWLGGDHYKWRLLRSNGIDENEITGNADDWTKFLRFSEMMPKAIGNPMYHWCHLELKRYFGYDGIICKETAKEIWDICNAKLAENDFSVRNLIRRSNVRFIGTTDDPTDNLEWHEAIAKDESFKTTVAPSFRPDQAINIEKAGFCDYIAKLGKVCGFEIDGISKLMKALEMRLDWFVSHGCKASDHGIDILFCNPTDEKGADKILKAALKGKTISEEEAEKYKTFVFTCLAEMYYKRDVAVQIHYNALRNVNSVAFEKLGKDTGFDTIRSYESSVKLAGILNELVRNEILPKIIVYSLNPNDNEVIGSIIGAFQTPGIAGKIQHGSAWWFNDSISGMEAQMKSLANLSLLGNFVGMLTDSRSFLSYTRHEYFRRILCNIIGQWAEDGLCPNDTEMLGQIVKDICYNNAIKYFNIQEAK